MNIELLLNQVGRDLPGLSSRGGPAVDSEGLARFQQLLQDAAQRQGGSLDLQSLLEVGGWEQSPDKALTIQAAENVELPTSARLAANLDSALPLVREGLGRNSLGIAEQPGQGLATGESDSEESGEPAPQGDSDPLLAPVIAPVVAATAQSGPVATGPAQGSTGGIEPLVRNTSILPGQQQADNAAQAQDEAPVTLHGQAQQSPAAQQSNPVAVAAELPVTDTSALDNSPSGREMQTGGITLGGPAGTDRMAATQPATTATPLASAELSTVLGSSRWQEDFNRELGQLVRLGEQRVALHLNPRDLGPLMIDLQVVDREAQMQFVSGHAQVRSAVEQAIPALRETLAEQGIQLGEAMVGQGSSSDRDSSAQGDQRRSIDEPGMASQTADATEHGAEPVQNIADGRISLYV